MDDTGLVTFVDRIKDCIRRRGENILAAEVEAALLQEDEVMLAVVPMPGASPTPSIIFDHASNVLPRFVELVSELSKTAIGKVQRAQLRKRGVGTRRVLWLGDTDGIYDELGETLPEISGENAAAAFRAVGGSAGTDVTGGMLLRLETARELARLGVESWIVNGHIHGLLAAGLRGEVLPGTRIAPS